MKTAEELHSRSVNYFDEKRNPVIMLESFKEALTEHDKEIISKIDEMIVKWRNDMDMAYDNGDQFEFNLATTIVNELTELKQWIKEK